LKKVRTEYLEKKDKETKKDVWDIAKIQKVSAPAGNLAAWAKAMSEFQRVWKQVEPKKAKLAEMQEAVAKAMASLNVKLEQVRVVKDRVAKLIK
jgi:hypothetical protein